MGYGEDDGEIEGRGPCLEVRLGGGGLWHGRLAWGRGASRWLMSL